MNKFEKLIEYIINDEDAKARELFHSIVVEKSRDIYESIMDEETVEETVAGNQVEDLVDEVGCEEEQTMEDGEDGEDFEVGADGFGDEEVGGEEVVGSDETGEGEEGQLLNIDAKLDELLAKFDEIMGDEVAGDEFGGEEEVAGDEFGGEEAGEELPAEVGAEEQFAEGKNPFAGSGKSGSAKSGVSGKSGSGSAKSGKSGKSGSGKSAGELMREYVEKIGDIYGGAGDASEGDAVGSAGKKTSVNTKPGSVGPGADFGGEAVTSKGGEQNQDGTSPSAAPKAEKNDAGNRNVPGGKAGNLETTGKKYETASDAEGQTTDGKVAVATKSVQKQNTGVKR